MAISASSGSGAASASPILFCSSSAPTCGPLPCVSTTSWPSARSASTASAISCTFSSCSGHVPACPALIKALPPTATTIRMFPIVYAASQAGRGVFPPIWTGGACASYTIRYGRLSRSAEGEDPVAKSDVIQLPDKGTELFDTSEKVFEDIKAEPGESAYTFMHTVPYEGSVGLVNLLTTTRVLRKGFKTHLVLYGPGVLMASGSRGFPKVGDEAFPGHMAINNQLRTFMDEGGTVYACRFASGALYGFPENLLMEGVKPFHPLDVLDAALTAWRDKAFQLNTWTV